MKKSIVFATVLAMSLSFSAAFVSLAGQWQQDSTGWWYQEDNNNYSVNSWKELDGKWYYFNQDGYMVSNTWIGNYYLGSDGAMLTNTTTPDGYNVGGDGAWIQNVKYSDEEMRSFKGTYTNKSNIEIASGDGLWLTILNIDNNIINGSINFGAGSSSGESSASFVTNLCEDNSIIVIMKGFNPSWVDGFLVEQDCADKMQICFKIDGDKKKVIVKRLEKGYSGFSGFEWFDIYFGDDVNEYELYELVD